MLQHGVDQNGDDFVTSYNTSIVITRAYCAAWPRYHSMGPGGARRHGRQRAGAACNQVTCVEAPDPCSTYHTACSSKHSACCVPTHGPRVPQRAHSARGRASSSATVVCSHTIPTCKEADSAAKVWHRKCMAGAQEAALQRVPCGSAGPSPRPTMEGDHACAYMRITPLVW